MLRSVERVDAMPSKEALRTVVDEWFRRIYVRSPEDVPDTDRQVMTRVFHDVADDFSPVDGYKAMCGVFFASADFAVY